MDKTIIIAAQVRAARALLGWSQEQLAEEAGVGLSSVRDVETSKRSPETQSLRSVRRALENAGVVFVPGDSDQGPGVRLMSNRPNVVRLPTVMTMWDGMPFSVEWKGKEFTVFVASAVLEDLGRFRERQSEAAYIEIFQKYRGVILDGVRRAIENPESYDRQGRVHVRGADIPELTG